MTKTLLLADRSEIMRAGMRALLQRADYQVVADCSSRNDVLDATAMHQPDIVIIGQNVAGQNAGPFLKQLRGHSASSRVVLVCENSDSSSGSAAIALHVHGVILQNAAGDRLLQCVRRVVAGYQWIDPDLLKTLLYTETRSPVLHDLTAREMEIANLVTRGLRNKQIARQMNISEATVKMHLHHVYEKLHVASRTELAIRAQSERAAKSSIPAVPIDDTPHSGNGRTLTRDSAAEATAKVA
jgi:two-component system nitrate/nitrite response regulator NarL